MQTLKQQTIDAISELPDMASADDIMDVLIRIIKKEPTEKTYDTSCFELMKEHIGCIKGPASLSSDKVHMEGYGE